MQEAAKAVSGLAEDHTSGVRPCAASRALDRISVRFKHSPRRITIAGPTAAPLHAGTHDLFFRHASMLCP